MLNVETEAIHISPVTLLSRCLPRLAIAAMFVGAGFSKFRGPMWVRLFSRIGFGQWLRYVAGVSQIAEGALTLVPPLCLVGIATLACTMADAVIVWIGFGFMLATIVPGSLLIILARRGRQVRINPLAPSQSQAVIP